jgi:hypothetical protein
LYGGGAVSEVGGFAIAWEYIGILFWATTRTDVITVEIVGVGNKVIVPQPSGFKATLGYSTANR